MQRRFNPDAKLFIGKVASKNLKECFDLFLYESDKDNDLDNVIKLIPFFETFHIKQLKDSSNSQDTSIKNSLKDHIIWKSKGIWEKIIDLRIKSTISEIE